MLALGFLSFSYTRPIHLSTQFCFLPCDSVSVLPHVACFLSLHLKFCCVFFPFSLVNVLGFLSSYFFRCSKIPLKAILFGSVLASLLYHILLVIHSSVSGFVVQPPFFLEMVLSSFPVSFFVRDIVHDFFAKVFVL